MTHSAPAAPWRSRITGSGEEAPDQLLANPANWRIHPKAQQEAPAGVLGQVGWVQQVLVNRRTGHVVDGHLRVALAIKQNAPSVPVLYVDLSPEEEALVLASLDPLAAMAGTDEDQLRTLLADMTVDSEALAAMLAQLAPPPTRPGKTDPDEIPAPPDQATTQPGDLWRLGEHRLLCGDAGSADDLDRLLDGAPVALLATDPPYNVKVEPRSNNAIAAGLSSFRPTTTHHQGFDLARHPEKAHPTDRKLRAKDRPLTNDFVTDAAFGELLAAWFGNAARVLRPGGGFYVWSGYANVANYPSALPGKTWTSAHTLAEWLVDEPGEHGIVAPTYADGRDVCVEGESGLLAALGTNLIAVEAGTSRYVRSWNRSMGELALRNGALAYVDGADDGATRIQGHNLAGCWASEIGLWRRWQQAWEESIRYAVRHGRARIVADGTPKRGHGLVRLLIDDPAVIKSRMRTIDNVAHLNPDVVDAWRRLYGGTALGRQELEGEVLEDVPGAAWQRAWIDRFRILVAPEMLRVSVAVDPALTSTEGADQTGLVACGAALVSPDWCRQTLAAAGVAVVPDSHGAGYHEHYFLLEDASTRMSPAEWGERAVRLYAHQGAGCIVAETNRGGEMVEHTVRTVSPNVAFRAVHATRGKVTRAEPIAALAQ